jgi:hypothetical protein
MIVINAGRICIDGDAIDFKTPGDRAAAWAEANALQATLAIGSTRLYVAEGADYHGHRVRAAFCLDRDGLQSLSLRRLDPSVDGEPVDLADLAGLRREFRRLRSLACHDSEASPPMENGRICLWNLDGYALQVVLDVQVFDVAVFYAREGAPDGRAGSGPC